MRLTFIIFLLAFTATAQGQNMPGIQFDTKEITFEKAKGGDVLNFTYHFINSGNAPLIINNIKVACSCTKPTWPKYPIMAGKRDSITVVFDTKTVWGAQEKELRIYSNAVTTYHSVFFKGMVKKGDYVKAEQKKKKQGE